MSVDSLRTGIIIIRPSTFSIAPPLLTSPQCESHLNNTFSTPAEPVQPAPKQVCTNTVSEPPRYDSCLSKIPDKSARAPQEQLRSYVFSKMSTAWHCNKRFLLRPISCRNVAQHFSNSATLSGLEI